MADAPVFPSGNNFKQSAWMDDAILQGYTSLGNMPGAQVANLARSGQLGTGVRFTKLDGATPAVFNPTTAVVLTVPSMWDPWPKLQEMLRALMETHAKSITGIDFGYELASESMIVGHDGQSMKVPTRTTRGEVTPSATFQEYTGMPVYNLFKTWMFDIQHPDTNASIIPAQINDRSQIPAWYMSAYSMTMLFIQYDPTGLPDRIYDACIITNMFPTNIGEVGFERTLGTTNVKERQITFTGLVQHNDNTRALGIRVAEMLALHKINFNNALPGLAGSTEVDKAIQTNIRDYGGLEYEAGGNPEYGGHVAAQDGGAREAFQFNGNTSDTQQFNNDIESRSELDPNHSPAAESNGSATR